MNEDRKTPGVNLRPRWLRLVLPASAFLLLAACADSRNVALAARRTGGTLELTFSPRGGLSVGNVEVWDVETREMIWKVFASRGGDVTLRYGHVPEAQPGYPTPKQLFPESGVPPRAPAPGHRLYVLVSGHFRNSFGGGYLLYPHIVTVGNNGEILSAVPQPRVQYSDVKMLPPAGDSR